MTKLFTLLFCFFSCLGKISAQYLSHTDSTIQYTDIELIPTIELPYLDSESLLKQDEINALNGDKTLRFGLPIQVNYSLEEISLKESLSSQTERWSIRIKGPNAKGLHVIFDSLALPLNAKMFILNTNGEILQGPFEQKNISASGTFSTLPVGFNDIILCCIANPEQTPFMNLTTIIQDYRNFNQATKEFGSSQFCNINVNCPVGDPYQDIKRSVVMLLTAFNSRFCSGAMVVNTSNDGTPYVLTANHCESAPSDIFLFNYESNGCSNQDGPTMQVVSGCSIVARNSATDFCLVELNEKPPLSYNAFLSGWNRLETPPNSGVFIHHPSGDIKKITIALDPSTSDLFQGAICWATQAYSDGSTESGSSGCPMYNDNKQIVGQLFGGPASCFNSAGDYYGKLSQSWNGPTQSSRLHDWLDPTQKGLQSMTGVEYTFSTAPIDARLSNITAPIDNICDNTLLNPRIRLKNMGTQALNSVTISYSFNGNLAGTFTSSNQLSPGQSQTLNIPSIFAAYADNQTFKAWITATSPTGDNNQLNDTISSVFNMKEGKRYRLILRTDQRSLETSWKIENLFTGQQLSGADLGTLAAERTYNYDICLSKGCYKFVINDENGDGICCSSGDGNYSLRDETGTTIESGGGFEFQKEFVFCVDTVISTQNLNALEHIVVYPNPAKNELFIETNKQAHQNFLIELFDLQGRTIISKSMIHSTEMLHTSSLPNGLYVLQISSNEGALNKKVVVNH